MSEPEATATDPTGDATATPAPEEAAAQLSEALGTEVSVEDLQTYMKDKGNWDKQKNRRLTELGVEKLRLQDEATTKQQEMLDRLTAIAERSTTTDAKGATHIIDPAQFAQRFGVEDWGEGVTAKQLYAAVEAVAQMGTREFGEVRAQVTKAEESLGTFQAEYGQDRAGIVQFLSDAEVDRLMVDYPDADRDVIYRAIGELEAGPDFEKNLEDAARKSHEKVEKRVADVVQKEKKRRSQVPAYTGAGRGAAVAGEAPPDVFTRAGIADFARRHAPGSVDDD